MLGQIMNRAVEEGLLQEEDFMNKSEREIMEILDNHPTRLYTTFRTMTSIEHTDQPLPPEDYFCVSLNVKQRYIDPLVASGSLSLSKGRLSQISPFARKIIEDFKSYHDTPFGCVKLIRH